MKLELLEDLYKQKLAELYDAEKQILHLLPKLTQATTHEELRAILEEHTEETKVHCQRLEQLIAKRGVEELRKSRAMNGILSESKELIKQEGPDGQILALALASAAQDVEGYEINGYACAHNYARLLGFHEDLIPLEQTFEDEKKMEEKLITLSDHLSVEEVESETEAEPEPARKA